MNITAEKYYDDNLENYNLLNKIDPMTAKQVMKMMEGYHQAKLKLLGLHKRQSLPIPNVVHHVKITDFIGEKVSFDDSGAGYIWGEEKDGGCQMIGEVRGWGAIQDLFKNKDGSIDFKKAEDFQDGLGCWIADAIQQKLEKERTPKFLIAVNR
jgi:ribosomal protein L30/L7E